MWQEGCGNWGEGGHSLKTDLACWPHVHFLSLARNMLAGVILIWSHFLFWVLIDGTSLVSLPVISASYHFPLKGKVKSAVSDSYLRSVFQG